MRAMLRSLLLSIEENTAGLAFEVLVVDNNSRDGTSEMIRKEFPNVTLISNNVNRGVAPSRNQAFRETKGRYVVTLDADMILKENSLKELFDFMESTPDAGLCGCKLSYLDGTVQPSARRYPTLLVFLLRRLSFIPWVRETSMLKYHEMAEWNRSDIRDVDYVIGACQFIRRDAMNQVGMLDDNIFYGPEDIDYCLRMYRNGWKVYYYPMTSIVHYEQRITKKKFFSMLTWLHFKGIIYLFNKYDWKLSRNACD